MTPLDLTKAPPRSPREELRGLCMLPRMIDIARAKLPGGDIGEYQIGRAKTISAVLLSAFGVTAAQFVELLEELGYERACPHLGPMTQEHASAVQSILTKKFAVLY